VFDSPKFSIVSCSESSHPIRFQHFGEASSIKIQAFEILGSDSSAGACAWLTSGNSTRARGPITIFIIAGLCSFFYLLGAWQRSGFGKGDSIALQMTKTDENCDILPNLNFETHHASQAGVIDDPYSRKPVMYKPCSPKYTDYTPCQDQRRAMKLSRENMLYRERHCPPKEKRLRCLIPAPDGYVSPFPWPKSRDYVPYANVPYKSLTVEKAIQNWVQYEGNVFRFPDGLYMNEVDRVLRPGGYWVLSGPPINWRTNYQAWQRPKEELEEQQRKIEEVAKLLCWEKKSEKGEIAIWQKSMDTDSCRAAQENSGAEFCKSEDTDNVWYKKMEPCITRYDIANSSELKPFPERLYSVPPRIASGSILGVSVEAYKEDNKQWRKHVNAYRKIIKIIDSGRFRNIMDMNAGFGGFAAALESPKLWVMNVVPTIADKNTLGVIYERGLIGIYHDWCEAFSTYPRTYDLIHANGVFSLYKDKCDFEDILLEMDRILRPEGTIIFRDNVDVLVKVKRMIGGLRYDSKMVDHEDGPLFPKKLLFAVKQYWVGNSTSEQ
ncbi:S-adenosyl-L-methionine-dependentmethyltransferases superfamily protein, partial [Striga asiatica]